MGSAAFASSLGGGGEKRRRKERKTVRLLACHCEVKLDGNILTVPARRPRRVSGLICAHVLALARVRGSAMCSAGGHFLSQAVRCSA